MAMLHGFFKDDSHWVFKDIKLKEEVSMTIPFGGSVSRAGTSPCVITNIWRISEDLDPPSKKYTQIQHLK